MWGNDGANWTIFRLYYGSVWVPSRTTDSNAEINLVVELRKCLQVRFKQAA
jgi:hypothetical protein